MNIEQIQQRIKHASQLHILGNNSQLNSSFSDTLVMSDYAGMISYHPEELVITVKAGTKVSDIKELLASNKQALAFASADNYHATIGGAYAIGSPDLRDAVLGIKVIDGQGQLLNFGGQVMKNVAGYDVARLLVGSQGKLVCVCEISLRVLPQAYAITSPPVEMIKSASKSAIRHNIEQGLKQVFDPKGIFI